MVDAWRIEIWDGDRLVDSADGKPDVRRLINRWRLRTEKARGRWGGIRHKGVVTPELEAEIKAMAMNDANPQARYYALAEQYDVKWITIARRVFCLRKERRNAERSSRGLPQDVPRGIGVP